MSEAVNDTKDKVDPALLKVNGNRNGENGTEYVKKLANAVLQTFRKHNVVRLRCVGAAAVNNADKSIAIASIEARKESIDLVERKFFTDVYFDDVKKTGILKEVVAFPKGDANGNC
jgi:stage V sporulation protein SpoVS